MIVEKVIHHKPSSVPGIFRRMVIAARYIILGGHNPRPPVGKDYFVASIVAEIGNQSKMSYKVAMISPVHSGEHKHNADGAAMNFFADVADPDTGSLTGLGYEFRADDLQRIPSKEGGFTHGETYVGVGTAIGDPKGSLIVIATTDMSDFVRFIYMMGRTHGGLDIQIAIKDAEGEGGEAHG